MKEQTLPRIPLLAFAFAFTVFTLFQAMTLILYKEWIPHQYEVIYAWKIYNWLFLLIIYLTATEYAFYLTVYITYMIRKWKEGTK